MTKQKKGTAKGRRAFLRTMAVGGAVAATGTVVAPNVSRGQTSPISMRWQSTCRRVSSISSHSTSLKK